MLPVHALRGGEKDERWLLLPELFGVSAAEESAAEEFFAGYRDAGGDAELEERVWWNVWCESRWQPWIVSVTGYLGLSQFSPGTWRMVALRTGLWQWESPYQQGFNTAALMQVASPASQWACWA